MLFLAKDDLWDWKLHNIQLIFPDRLLSLQGLLQHVRVCPQWEFAIRLNSTPLKTGTHCNLDRICFNPSAVHLHEHLLDSHWLALRVSGEVYDRFPSERDSAPTDRGHFVLNCWTHIARNQEIASQRQRRLEATQAFALDLYSIKRDLHTALAFKNAWISFSRLLQWLRPVNRNIGDHFLSDDTCVAVLDFNKVASGWPKFAHTSAWIWPCRNLGIW